MSRPKQPRSKARSTRAKLSLKKQTVKDLSGSTRVKGGAKRVVASIASPACLSLTCVCRAR